MLSSIVKKLVNRFLNDYVEGEFDVGVSFFGKHAVDLEHLELKCGTLNDLIFRENLPFRFEKLYIGHALLDIPFSHLGSQPVKLSIKNALAVVKMQLEGYWNEVIAESDIKEGLKNALLSLLKEIHPDSEVTPLSESPGLYFSSEGMLNRTITRVIDNLEIHIENISVRVEVPCVDDQEIALNTYDGGRFQGNADTEGHLYHGGFPLHWDAMVQDVSVLDLTIAAARLITTDENWERHFDDDCDYIVYKLFKILGLEVTFGHRDWAMQRIVDDAARSRGAKTLSVREYYELYLKHQTHSQSVRPLLSPVNLELRAKLNTAFTVGAAEPHRMDAQLKVTPVCLAVGEDELVFLMQILAHNGRHGQWLERIRQRQQRINAAWIEDWRKTRAQDALEEYMTFCNRRARILTRVTDPTERNRRFEELQKNPDLIELEKHLPLEVLVDAIREAGERAQETRDFKLQPFQSQESFKSEDQDQHVEQHWSKPGSVSSPSRLLRPHDAVVSGTGWQKELASSLESEFVGTTTSKGRLAKPGLDPDEIEITFGEGALGLVLDQNFQNDSVVVAGCIAGSQAARTRMLEQGMVITAIGNYDVTDLSVEETLSKLRNGRRPMRVRFRGSEKAARMAANFVKGSVVNFIRGTIAIDSVDATLFAGAEDRSLCVGRLIGIVCSFDTKSAGAAVGPMERLSHIVNIDLNLGIVHADIISALPSSIASDMKAPIHIVSSACEFDQDGMLEPLPQRGPPPDYDFDINWNPFDHVDDKSVGAFLEDRRWIYSCFVGSLLVWDRRRLHHVKEELPDRDSEEESNAAFSQILTDIDSFEAWRAQSTIVWRNLILASGTRHFTVVPSEELPPLLEYSLRIQRLTNCLEVCQRRPFANLSLSLSFPDPTMRPTDPDQDFNIEDDHENVEEHGLEADVIPQSQSKEKYHIEIPFTYVALRGSVSDIELCMQEEVFPKLVEFGNSLSARTSPFQGHKVPGTVLEPPDYTDPASLSWTRYEIALRMGILRAVLPDAAMAGSKNLLRAAVVVGPIGIYPRHGLPEEAVTALDHLRKHRSMQDMVFMRVDRLRLVVVKKSATPMNNPKDEEADDDIDTLLLQRNGAIPINMALRLPLQLPRPLATSSGRTRPTLAHSDTGVSDDDGTYFDAEQSIRTDFASHSKDTATTNSDVDDDAFEDAIAPSDEVRFDLPRRQVSWQSASRLSDDSSELDIDGPSSISLVEMYLNLLRFTFRGAPYSAQPIEVGLVLGDLNVLVSESQVMILLELVNILTNCIESIQPSTEVDDADDSSSDGHSEEAMVAEDAAKQRESDAILDHFHGTKDPVEAMEEMHRGLQDIVDTCLGVNSLVYSSDSFVLSPVEACTIFERMCDFLGPVLAKDLTEKVDAEWIIKVGSNQVAPRTTAFFYGELWLNANRLNLQSNLGMTGETHRSSARRRQRSATQSSRRSSTRARATSGATIGQDIRPDAAVSTWVTMRLDVHITNIRVDLFTIFKVSLSGIDVNCSTSTSNHLSQLGFHIAAISMVNFRSREGENPMVIQPIDDSFKGVGPAKVYCASFFVLHMAGTLEQALQRDPTSLESQEQESTSSDESYSSGGEEAHHSGDGSSTTSGDSSQDVSEEASFSDEDRQLHFHLDDDSNLIERKIADFHNQSFRSPIREKRSLQAILDSMFRVRSRVRRIEEQLLRSCEDGGMQISSNRVDKGCGALLWNATNPVKPLHETGRQLLQGLRTRSEAVAGKETSDDDNSSNFASRGRRSSQVLYSLPDILSHRSRRGISTDKRPTSQRNMQLNTSSFEHLNKSAIGDLYSDVKAVQKIVQTAVVSRESHSASLNACVVLRDLTVELSERLALTGLELLDIIQRILAKSNEEFGDNKEKSEGTAASTPASPSSRVSSSNSSATTMSSSESRDNQSSGSPTLMSGLELAIDVHGLIVRVKASRDKTPSATTSPGVKNNSGSEPSGNKSRQGESSYMSQSNIESVTEMSSTAGKTSAFDHPSAISGSEVQRKKYNEIYIDVVMNFTAVYVARQCVETCELKISRTTISISYDRVIALFKRQQQNHWSRTGETPTTTVTHAIMKPWDGSLEYTLRRTMSSTKNISRVVAGTMSSLQLSLWTTDVSVLQKIGIRLGEISASVSSYADFLEKNRSLGTADSQSLHTGAEHDTGNKENPCDTTDNQATPADGSLSPNSDDTDNSNDAYWVQHAFLVRHNYQCLAGVSALAVAMNTNIVLADSYSYGLLLEASMRACSLVQANPQLYEKSSIVIAWFDQLTNTAARSGTHFSAKLQPIFVSRDESEDTDSILREESEQLHAGENRNKFVEHGLSPVIEDDRDILDSDNDSDSKANVLERVDSDLVLHEFSARLGHFGLDQDDVAETLHDRVKLNINGIAIELVQEVRRSESRVESFLPVLRIGADEIELRGESFSQFSKDMVLATFIDMEAKFYNRRIGSWEYIMEPWRRTKASLIVSEADQSITADLEALSRLNINISEDLLTLLLQLQADLESAAKSTTKEKTSEIKQLLAEGADDADTKSLTSRGRTTASRSKQTMQRTLGSKPARQQRSRRHRRRRRRNKSKKVVHKDAQHWFINNTGVEVVMYDLYQIGYDYRGTIIVSYRDGWYLPSHERWNEQPLMRLTLLPYRRRGTVGNLGEGGDDEVNHNSRNLPIGFANVNTDEDFDSSFDESDASSQESKNYVLRPYRDKDKYVLPYEGSKSNDVPQLLVEVKDETGTYYQTTIDLVPYILFPNQGSSEWFPLTSDGSKLENTRGAEIMLTVEFQLDQDVDLDPNSMLREVYGGRTSAIEPFRIASGAMVPMNFHALPKKHWYKNINRYEINKGISSKRFTKLRAVAVDFSLGLDFTSQHKPLLMVFPVDESGETMLTTRAVSNARGSNQREIVPVANPLYEATTALRKSSKRSSASKSGTIAKNDSPQSKEKSHERNFSLFRKARQDDADNEERNGKEQSFSFNVFGVNAMRDQKRRVIFLESPVKLLNAVDLTLEVMICEKGTVSEQENRKDLYPTLEPIPLEHADIRTSGNHLSNFGMDVMNLFDRRISSRWVDGGHRMLHQSEEAAFDAEMLNEVNMKEGAGFTLDSYIEWRFATPKQVCLYRITPTMVKVGPETHGTPADRDKQVDASKLGLDPVHWIIFGKVIKESSEPMSRVNSTDEEPVDHTMEPTQELEQAEGHWVLLDERKEIMFDKERRPREFFLPQVGSFNCYRIEMTTEQHHKADNTRVRKSDEEIDLSLACCGPNDSFPVGLAGIELFGEKLLARRHRVLMDSGVSSSFNSQAHMSFDADAEVEDVQHFAHEAWICPTCDTENSGDDDTCEMCGASKPEVHNEEQTNIIDQDFDPVDLTDEEAKEARKKRARSIQDQARQNAIDRLRNKGGANSQMSMLLAEGDDDQFAKSIGLDKFVGKVQIASEASTVRGASRFRSRRVQLTLRGLSIYRPRNTTERGRNLLYRQIGRRSQQHMFETEESRSRTDSLDSGVDSDGIQGTTSQQSGSSTLVRRRSGSQESGADIIELEFSANTILRAVNVQRMTLRVATPSSGNKGAQSASARAKRETLRLEDGILLRFTERESFRRWFDAIEAIIKRTRKEHQGKVVEVEEFTGMRRLLKPGEEFSIPLNYLYSTQKWSLFLRPDAEDDRVPVRWAQILDHISAQALQFEESVDNVIPNLYCEPYKVSSRIKTEYKLDVVPYSFSAAFTKRFLKGHHAGEDDTSVIDSSTDLIPRVEIAIRAWVRVVNALPFAVEVRFSQTSSGEELTIEPGQEINMSRIGHDEEAQFRIPALDSDWCERQKLESLSLFQESTRKVFGNTSERQRKLNSGTPIMFWKKGGNRQYMKNVVAEAKIDRSRDPTGPLYVVLYAPFWFYNYSDVDILTQPRESFLSPGDESKDVLLMPNFLPDSTESTKGVHILPHLRNLEGKSKLVCAVALKLADLDGAKHDPAQIFEGPNSWHVDEGEKIPGTGQSSTDSTLAGATGIPGAATKNSGRIQAAKNNWLTDFESEHQEYMVSAWSKHFKVQSTSSNITWRSFRFVINAVTILRREIGIEVVTGGVNTFTRSVQVIFRSKFLIVNRIPRTNIHFIQSAPQSDGTHGYWEERRLDYIQRSKKRDFLRMHKKESEANLEGDGSEDVSGERNGNALDQDETGQENEDANHVSGDDSVLQYDRNMRRDSTGDDSEEQRRRLRESLDESEDHSNYGEDAIPDSEETEENETVTALRINGVEFGKTTKDVYIGPNPNRCHPFHFGGFQKEFLGHDALFRFCVVNDELKETTRESAVILASKEAELSLMLRSTDGSARGEQGARRVRVAIRKEQGTTFIIFSEDISVGSNPRPFYVIRNETPFPIELWQDRMNRVQKNLIVNPESERPFAWDNPNVSRELRARAVWPILKPENIHEVEISNLVFESGGFSQKFSQKKKHKKDRMNARLQLQSTLRRDPHAGTQGSIALAYETLSTEGLFSIDTVKQFDDLHIVNPTLFDHKLSISVEGFIDESTKTLAFRLSRDVALKHSTLIAGTNMAMYGIVDTPGSECTASELSDDDDQDSDGFLESDNEHHEQYAVPEEGTGEANADGAQAQPTRRPSLAHIRPLANRRRYHVSLRLVLKADSIFHASSSSSEQRTRYKVVVRVGGKSREFSGVVSTMPSTTGVVGSDMSKIAEDLKFSLETKPTQVFILVYSTDLQDNRKLLRSGIVDLIRQLWLSSYTDRWIEVNSSEWQRCVEDIQAIEKDQRRRVQELLNDGFTNILKRQKELREQDKTKEKQRIEIEREKSYLSATQSEHLGIVKHTSSSSSRGGGGGGNLFTARSTGFLPMRTRQPTLLAEDVFPSLPLIELHDPGSELSSTMRVLSSSKAKRTRQEDESLSIKSYAWMQIRCEIHEPKHADLDDTDDLPNHAVAKLGEAATVQIKVFLSSVGLSLVHASQRLEICYAIVQRLRVFAEISPGSLMLGARLGHFQVDNHDPDAQFEVIIVPERRPAVNPDSRYPYPREDFLALEAIVRQSDDPYLELETFDLELSKILLSFEESFLGNLLSLWAKVLEGANREGSIGLDSRTIEHPPASTAHFILQVQALADFMYVYWFKIGAIQVLIQCQLDGGRKITAEDQISTAIKQYVPTLTIQDFVLRINEFSRANEFKPGEEFYRILMMHFIQEAVSRNLQTALTQTNFSLNPFPACKTIAIGAYEMGRQPYAQRGKGCGGVCHGCQLGLAAFIASLSAGVTDMIHAYTDFSVLGLENVANANQFDIVARPVTLMTAVFRDVTYAISFSSHKIANDLLNPPDQIGQIRTPRMFTRSGEMILYGPGNRPFQQDLATQRAAVAVFHFVYDTWRLRQELKKERESLGNLLEDFDPREYMQQQRMRAENMSYLDRWGAYFRDIYASLQHEFANARNTEGDDETEENERLLPRQRA